MICYVLFCVDLDFDMVVLCMVFCSCVGCDWIGGVEVFGDE